MAISLFDLTDSETAIGWRTGTPVSRHEFLARVAGWHAALKPLAGQQFALYLEDRIEFAAALVGAWHAGKTIWLSADTLAGSIAALQQKVDGFIGTFPTDCLPIANPPSETYAVDFSQPGPDFIAVVVHTSGTTGAAQAIPKRLSQLTREVAMLEQLFGVKLAHAEVVSTVSHQHIYGLLFTVLWPLYAGRAMHAETLIYPEQLALQLASRRCVVISSPAHLKRLPAHLDWTPAHVQAVFCSGGVLPPEVALGSAVLLGSAPIEVYGSSETGGIAWRQHIDHHQQILQSSQTWQVWPDVAWRCAPDSALIAVRSPRLFDDAWMTLSDRVEVVADDRFILHGRSDRIVKIEEKRISLDAVEQTLSASSLIAEVKIIVASQGWTHGQTQRQHLAAVVVLSEQGQQCLREQGKLAVNRQLKAQLNNSVESVAVPRRWRYVECFPVNAQGKTPQAWLHALFDGRDQHATVEESKEPLYTLQHRDQQQNQQHAEFEVRWGRHLPYFAGHFPNAPVLPGVAQVHWAIKIGRELFEIPHSFHVMHGVKFQQVVLPDAVTQLKLQYDTHKNCLSFTYASATKQHSSGRILFDV